MYYYLQHCLCFCLEWEYADLIKNGHMKDHELHKGDLVIFASVGAGMHINAITYKY